MFRSYLQTLAETGYSAKDQKDLCDAAQAARPESPQDAIMVEDEKEKEAP